MRQVIYWDSDVFLALINEDKSVQEMIECNSVWVAAEKGMIHIVTSTLTTTEVIHKRGTPKLDPLKRPLVSNFFRQDFISQKPLTREIAELARDVVWDSNIHPKDAVHVATCAYFRIRSMHTYDRNLIDKSVIEVNGFQILISKPSAPVQMEMQIE